jgi:hypothetical protein
MKFLLLITALAATCTALAQEASEAILDYTDDLGAFANTTVGWTFQTTTTLTVTSLGCFADVFVNNPAVIAIQVGLWDHNGSLLASNSITPGSTLFDQTRYESINPVSLNSGQTYHLGAFYSGGSIGYDVADPALGGSVSTAAQVQLRATAVGSASFSSPAEQAGTEGSIYAGPNFRFQSQPQLTIQLWPANQVQLSWPAGYPGYTVQSKLGLFGVWGNAGLSATVVGNAFVSFDSIGPGPKYYRLLK